MNNVRWWRLSGWLKQSISSAAAGCARVLLCVFFVYSTFWAECFIVDRLSWYNRSVQVWYVCWYFSSVSGGFSGRSTQANGCVGEYEEIDINKKSVPILNQALTTLCTCKGIISNNQGEIWICWNISMLKTTPSSFSDHTTFLQHSQDSCAIQRYQHQRSLYHWDC